MVECFLILLMEFKYALLGLDHASIKSVCSKNRYGLSRYDNRLWLIFDRLERKSSWIRLLFG